MKISKDNHMIFIISTMLIGIVSHSLGMINPAGFIFGGFINIIQVIYLLLISLEVIVVDK